MTDLEGRYITLGVEFNTGFPISYSGCRISIELKCFIVFVTFQPSSTAAIKDCKDCNDDCVQVDLLLFVPLIIMKAVNRFRGSVSTFNS